MPTDKPRFTVVADDELLSAIKRYQIRHHISSHTEAVRELLSFGIELAEMDPSLDRTQVFRREEIEVLANYRASDPETKLNVRLQLKQSADIDRPKPQLRDVVLPMHSVIELLRSFESASPEIQKYVLSVLQVPEPDSADAALAESVDKKIPGLSDESAEDSMG